MSSKQCSLDSLPFEIIEYILRSEIISYTDICRLSCVSQLFNCISRSNKLWGTKYGQMWPSTAKLFDPVCTDWRDEFERRIKFVNAIHAKLLEMTQEFYHLDNVSNDSFHDFKSLCDNHPLTDHILIAELGKVVYDSNSNVNLTIKYYAEKALIYVRHTMLDTVWRTFLDVEPRPSLLKGACLIQQWCQPSKIDCTSEVSRKVNELVELVFNNVKEVCPTHPVINRGYSCIQHDSGEILEKSEWSPYHCKVILRCINNILFVKLGWLTVESISRQDDIYIDKVIDKSTGMAVPQGTVYETIASQLGVHLLPVNFPGHFLLKWLEHPEHQSEYAWTYIDILGKGQFKKEHELGDLAQGYDNISVNSWLEPASPKKVFAGMCWSLVEIGRQHDESGDGLSCLCNSLELLTILCPDDMEHKLLLARVYMHLCINVTRVIGLLQEVAANDPISTGLAGHMYRSAIATLASQDFKKETKKLEVQQRGEDCADVKFAVGMLMTHKKYNYRCVICGWDPVCSASKDWIKRMGVNRLPHKAKQPFYHVLVSDGTNRYAAQENLEIDHLEEPITHREVGRYFESFHGSYYLPNEQKNIEYPDDIEARERALAAAVPCSLE